MRNQLVLVITAFFLLGGAILTASAAGSSPSAAKATKLIVAMHDPGCHWFVTGGSMDNRKYGKTVVRTGAVNLVNLDEATLIIKGPGGIAPRQGRRDADAQGEGRLQDHDGQAGGGRQPPEAHHQVTRASRVSMREGSPWRAFSPLPLLDGASPLTDTPILAHEFEAKGNPDVAPAAAPSAT